MSENGDNRSSKNEIHVAPSLATLASERRLSQVKKKKRKTLYRQLDDGMPTFSGLGWLARKCLKNGYDLNGWRINCSTNCRQWLNIFSFGEGERNMRSVTGVVGFRESTEIFEMSQSWQTDGWVSTTCVDVDTAVGVLTSLLKCAYFTKEKYVVRCRIVCV